MYRKHRAFLSGLAIVSLTATAASQWCWAQGIPVRLTYSNPLGSDPALSPDGTKIAFVSDPRSFYNDFRIHNEFGIHPAIYVMNADGTDPVRLKWRMSGQDYFRNPAWSPDGTKIAFEASLAGDIAIYVMNADGTGFLRLAPPPSSSWGNQVNEAPRWSPDGTKIAFRNPDTMDIYVINPDGTEPVRLTGGEGDSTHSGYLEWSPDGTKIAFVSQARHSHLSSGQAIYVMNLDGTAPVQLTQMPRMQMEQIQERPRWSPDGTKIAFVSMVPGIVGIESPAIYVMNADGTGRVRLAEEVAYNLAWSPDGTKIAFVDASWNWRIDLMNADGTDRVNLTWEWGPHLEWSPDGTKIFFESSHRGMEHIYVIPYGPAPMELRAPPERATSVGPNSTTPGALEQPWDVDYFRVDVTQAGRLMVETTGETDTFGVFQSARGWSIADDDDDGAEDNFRIARDVSPGTYYVEVTGYNLVATGVYTLRIAFTPAGNTERGDRRATLLNLSPWQAWVHLYCLKDRGTDADPCVVTFECNGQTGEPASWPVTVAPKTIFSYWPNKTAPDGTSADLQAALIAAGKLEDEARRRTTCEVFSPDPLTVRGYTLFGGQPTLVPVAEPARPDVAAEPGEPQRRATLPNLSPWQAWVHLYCLKDRGTDADPCVVTFECNGQSGEPVTWPVAMWPKTIFSYWPNKTVDGLSADLQAALVAAGKPEDEARRRTTCEVSSADPIAVRGYTRFGGQPTLVPVTAY